MNIFDEEINRLQESKKQAEEIIKKISEQNKKIVKANTMIDQAMKQKGVHYQELIALVDNKKTAADITGVTTKEINQCVKLLEEKKQATVDTPAPTGYKQNT